MTVRKILDERFSKALASVGAPEGSPAIVMPATKGEFGDYQVNGVMPAAKKLKTDPRQLAEKVVGAADLADIVESAEVAGPGFINIRVKSELLSDRLEAALADEHLGVARPAESQTIVVDYSSPNLAKEMHVGHLRSTIIGEALARTLEFQAHCVIRQNHVGDWGTHFGMLIAHMPVSFYDIDIPDLEVNYSEARRRFDADPEFATNARRIVAQMHEEGPKGKSNAMTQWRQFRLASLTHCYRVYARLGITFTPKGQWRDRFQPNGLEQVPPDSAPPEHSGIDGESFYNDMLPSVVADLAKAGLLTESQGAQCVFLDEFKGKDGDPLPVIVQKTDGAYLYSTTDLAAMRYRVSRLEADRILYVTDSRQVLHFRQVFAVARKAEFVPEGVSLEHVPFGTMQDTAGRPFKTREGGVVKLMDLLDEAEQRAAELIEEKNPDLSAEQKASIAHVVGIGAVKYADLSHNRASDYVFSWEKMLSLEGNTAPYMQYAYARIRSIFRKGAESDRSTNRKGGQISVTEPAERTLAVRLTQFAEAVESVAAECLPNLMCNYLFDLAGAFMSFYEQCPVLQSDQPVRSSRLAMCDLTARTIKTGLDLLGIETIEQM